MPLKIEDTMSTTEGDVTETDINESLRLIEDLKYFLATAPVNWQANQIIRRYFLGGEDGFVSCVFWNNLYYITGTDILRCCFYRMEKFGRKIIDKKKFQEGIFSDLRSLKIGEDATLELARSDFLHFLHKNSCLKTQKKQKVFYWFSVQHDKLFADALERDLKRELLGQKTTSVAIREPALSFEFNEVSAVTLYEQLTKHMQLRNMVSPVQSLSQENKYLSQEFNESVKTPTLEKVLGKSSPRVHQKRMPNIIDQNTPTSASTSTSVTVTSEAQKHLKDNDNLKGLDPVSSNQKFVSTTKGNSPNTENDIILNRKCMSVENDKDEFPLDYFPVEIEYPDRPQRILAPQLKNFANPLFSATSETGSSVKNSNSTNNNKHNYQIISSTSEFDLNGDMELGSNPNAAGYPQESSSATGFSSNVNKKDSGYQHAQELDIPEKTEHNQELPEQTTQSYMDYLLSPGGNQNQGAHHKQQYPPMGQQYPHVQQQYPYQQFPLNAYYTDPAMYQPFMHPSGYYSQNHPYTSSTSQLQNQYPQYRQPDFYYGRPPPSFNQMHQQNFSYGFPSTTSDPYEQQLPLHGSRSSQLYPDGFLQGSPTVPNFLQKTSKREQQASATGTSAQPHQPAPMTPMYGRMFNGMVSSATVPMFPGYLQNNSPIVTTNPGNLNMPSYNDHMSERSGIKPNKITKKAHNRK